MAGEVRSKGETADTGFAGVCRAKALDDPAEERNVAAGDPNMGEVHQLVTSEQAFGLQTAGRLMATIFAPWVLDWHCWWKAWKRSDRRARCRIGSLAL